MLTQDNRFITITTPLGKDVLVVRGFEGTDSISMPFSYELDLVSDDSNIKFEDIIGKKVTVSIALDDGGARYFNGIVSRFSQISGSTETEDELQLARYSATMVPWLWLLTRSSDSKIFQNLSVPEIVQKIFGKPDFQSYSFKMNLQGSYTPKEYCVQYRETDFNFVSRLLEQEGIFYFFEHEDGNHTMVLGDSPQEHKLCPGQGTVKCQSVLSRVRVEEDMIATLGRLQEIMVGKYTVKDFNFKMPSTDLKVEVPGKQRLGPGELEFYDYPADYTIRAEGETVANLRMQAEEAKITTITGSSSCRVFSSGYRFVLDGHYRDDMNNRAYVLKSVNHWASEPAGSSGDEAEVAYVNSFVCIPWDVPFRPPMLTPKPLIGGVQTAIVTGPAGEEIYTEEFGRVKVQFHWDREGKKDDKSSCWIRVGQLWAGSSWGGVYLPRIGQEVIVDFLEGDPDRPIIVGCVYHGENKPHYDLPDHKTRSTIRSESSTGGDGYNEIRLEDKKGEEHFYLHAQRNHDIIVEKNLHRWVGEESHLMTIKDQLEDVGGDNHLHVGGDLNEKVDGTISLQAGMNLQAKAGMNAALEAGQIHLKAGMTIVLEAGAQLSLKVGGNFIDINPGGVFIQGSMVMINSGGAAGEGAGCSPKEPKPPEQPKTPEEPWT
jgi:type VI secretion system secreted protein VgrG